MRLPVATVFLLAVTAMPPACVWGQADEDQASTSPRTVDGYRGIWFTLGQFYGPSQDAGQVYAKVSRKPVFPFGDKYSGGLGTYTAKHVPLAIYDAAVDKTFFVYGGTTGANDRHLLCMISYYDHATHQVPRPVVVHDKDGVDDPHDNPSLSIDDDGHIWVFVSGRGRARPGFKYRSTLPHSIEAFELVSSEEMTYPQPHFIPGKGFLHLFTKYTGVRELYFETSLDGRTWTDDKKLASIRQPLENRTGHYQTSASHGGTVGTFFNRHPNGNVDRRTDIYYVKTDDMGAHWSTVDGTPLELPLYPVDSPARVVDYATQGLNVYAKDMGFDRDGHPVFLYVTSPAAEPGSPNDPRHFRITRWDGQQWKTNVICLTDHNYDMGSLYLSDDLWSIVIPSQVGPQAYQGGGEMAKWESRDQGESWNLTRQLTVNSPRNHNYARRPIGAKDPFYTFWADGDPTQISQSHLYFADSSGQKVYRLPYDMDQPLATPTPVGNESP
ncbi:hypothetical protein K227x_46190 [Rubripirellula lacrimiformis]|uniref:BNR/Asp-box repeat protein n=1 Tax=Rubripirellula lacrimiformis TaxID=1930273 RepID=A0A517NGG1_9BACT|nr:BNR-4 repeat-containing protein [Rubripirellula lacrimiformis]QDT06211.1 hypothetical protein K227x_46190 [Rubripirellula lacrimiformis]